MNGPGFQANFFPCALLSCEFSQPQDCHLCYNRICNAELYLSPMVMYNTTCTTRCVFIDAVNVLRLSKCNINPLILFYDDFAHSSEL